MKGSISPFKIGVVNQYRDQPSFLHLLKDITLHYRLQACWIHIIPYERSRVENKD